MARRDWSDLPLDIFRLICQKLPNIRDFVVLRSVCKTWWSCKCDPPLQLPWILEHRNYADDQPVRFYSLLSGNIISINCDKAFHKFFLGPSHHSVLSYCCTESGIAWSLVNPLTNNEIALPPPEDGQYWIKWIGPYPAGSSESVVFSECGFTSSYSSAMMNLPRSEDYDADHEFALKRLNGSCRLYHKGEFFYVDNVTGGTRVTDATTQKLVYELPPTEPSKYYYCRYWLVESGGEVLMLSKLAGVDPIYFYIYRLDLKNGKDNASWVEIDSITEQVLFLDRHQGLSYSSKDYEGLGENCIYLLEDGLLYKYDIKDGTVENLDCPFAGCYKTWFAPRHY